MSFQFSISTKRASSGRCETGLPALTQRSIPVRHRDTTRVLRCPISRHDDGD